MDRALGRAHEARAHLDSFGPQRKGCRHAASVADAAGRDHRHVGLLPHRLQQDQGRDVVGILEPAALAAFDDQTVDAGIDGL